MPMPKSVWIACLLAFGIAAQQTTPSLDDLLKKSYLDLASLAPKLELPRKTIDDYRRQVEARKKEDVDALDAERKQRQAELDDLHRQLDDLNRSANTDDAAMKKRRNDLHCKLRQAETDLRDARAQRSTSVPAAHDHRLTKLEILAQWPARKKEIDDAIAAGKARARHWGDIDDIGYRKLGEGQERDLKLGEDAVNELRAYRLLPPEVDSRPIADYVRELAERMAAASDLKVPVRTAVLESDEINAFGLPGGRLFVTVGLIRRTANEAELAGVMSHEIAHIAARHGERLSRPTGNMRNLLLQGATMAADAFTFGAVGQAKNAAHDYLGLGAHLNLSLLGVNRETEGEAGQLSAQYLWKAGYDDRGFVHFYDRMASEEDRGATASFFRTHPPAVERALVTLSELEYLPKQIRPRTNSERFVRTRALAEAWLKLHARAPVKAECGE
jgi:Zn-dependent protease with chaperone function/Skp family chaperone for outer membrane proteins